MALTLRHKITVNTPQTLISAGDNAGNIKSINIANVHGSTANNIDLWIVNCGIKYYIIKNVKLPAGAALSIDLADINIDTRSGVDTLRIKLSTGSVGIDVIINK